MTNKRIKDLTTASPVDAAHFLALDSASGGTKKAAIADTVSAALTALGVQIDVDGILSVKHNFDGDHLPGASDDSSAGYGPGSMWFAPGLGFGFCIDATLGAAVWLGFISSGDLSNSAPQPIGTSGPGTDNSPSRADHVHAHGNQGGGSLHAAVVASGASGFMTGADKAKLDGISAGADVTLTKLALPGAPVVVSDTSHDTTVRGSNIYVTSSGQLEFSAGGDILFDGPPDMQGHAITSVGSPGSASDAATAQYADQPVARTVTGTSATLGTADIGGFIKLTNGGSITVTTANLSSALRSGGALVISLIITGGGAITIADGSGCTHSGSVAGTSAMLWSDDGVTWVVR